MTTPVTAVAPEEAGAWLAASAHARPQQVATAMRLIAAGGRTNDSCLHARQYLEPALGASPDRPLTGADYLAAAALLHRSQESLAAGDVMESMAGVDGELRAAAPAWLGRYAARPLPQPEQTPSRWSATARLGNPATPDRASTARTTSAPTTRCPAARRRHHTSAMREEVVNSPSTRAASAWLAARLDGGTAC